jgi:hypothetical protein
MTTTTQKMRDVFVLEQELFDKEPTLQDIVEREYQFPTNNKKTIERIYYEVREEVRLIEQIRKELKQEFNVVAL